MSQGTGTRVRREAWRGWFTVGLVLWAASAVVTYWTENPTLLPTVILLGSFLVPTTFVLWAFETRAGSSLSPTVVLKAFVVGGVLGVLLASVLESALLTGQRPLLMYAGVGLIEEAAKLAAMWWVARDLTRHSRRDGMILGAAVGFGFAAFETAGYAFNALVTLDGYDLRALLEIEVLRSVLSPVGHGLWSAVLGGALFASAQATGRFRITRELVVTYLAMSGLHALWDMAGGLAAVLTWVFTASEWQTSLLQAGRLPTPTAQQVHISGALTWLILTGVAVWGVWVLGRRWQAAKEEDPAA
ncbi:MAG: PrsW family intramembrane metalloprotease [Candidatus Nanopelagicales bacterium]